MPAAAPPRRPKVAKKKTSFSISEEVDRILAELEAETGITRTSIVEMAVRDFYKKRKRQGKSKQIPEKPGSGS
jgi:predicted transcriptional regulator